MKGKDQKEYRIKKEAVLINGKAEIRYHPEFAPEGNGNWKSCRFSKLSEPLSYSSLSKAQKHIDELKKVDEIGITYLKA